LTQKAIPSSIGRYIKDELETIGAFLGDGFIEDFPEKD